MAPVEDLHCFDIDARGKQRVVLELRADGFEIDGLEMKVREDFGGAILDFRGLYKANGA